MDQLWPKGTLVADIFSQLININNHYFSLAKWKLALQAWHERAKNTGLSTDQERLIGHRLMRI